MSEMKNVLKLFRLKYEYVRNEKSYAVVEEAFAALAARAFFLMLLLHLLYIHATNRMTCMAHMMKRGTTISVDSTSIGSEVWITKLLDTPEASTVLTTVVSSEFLENQLPIMVFSN